MRKIYLFTLATIFIGCGSDSNKAEGKLTYEDSLEYPGLKKEL